MQPALHHALAVPAQQVKPRPRSALVHAALVDQDQNLLRMLSPGNRQVNTGEAGADDIRPAT